jgi:hypothetical protein
MRAAMRRLARAGVGCLLGGAMAIQLGPTTTSQAVNQMNATSMRGLPTAPAPPEASRDTMIWVPSYLVRLPGNGTVSVPGHWERTLEGRDVHVPPLNVRNPATGEVTTLPAGIRPPTAERVGP